MSVILGNDKYVARVETLRDGVLFTAAEHAEWNNGEEAFASAAQVADLVKGLTAILIGSTDVEVEFGDEKYCGLLSPLSNGDASTVGIIEIAEWGDFNNGAEAVFDIVQGQNLLNLLNSI